MFAFQDVDWGLGKFTVTDIRDTVIDYTSPFWHEPALIVMKKPVSDALLLYLGPFQQEVWFCLLLSLPLMTIIIAVMNYAEHHIGETGNSPSLKTLCITCFWVIFGAMFQQGKELIMVAFLDTSHVVLFHCTNFKWKRYQPPSEKNVKSVLSTIERMQ